MVFVGERAVLVGNVGAVRRHQVMGRRAAVVSRLLGAPLPARASGETVGRLLGEALEGHDLIADLEGIARAQVAPKGLKAFGAFDRGPVGAVERVGSKQNGQAVATAGRG